MACSLLEGVLGPSNNMVFRYSSLLPPILPHLPLSLPYLSFPSLTPYPPSLSPPLSPPTPPPQCMAQAQHLELKEKEALYRLHSSEQVHQKAIQELRDALTAQQRIGARSGGRGVKLKEFSQDIRPFVFYLLLPHQMERGAEDTDEQI